MEVYFEVEHLSMRSDVPCTIWSGNERLFITVIHFSGERTRTINSIKSVVYAIFGTH